MHAVRVSMTAFEAFDGELENASARALATMVPPAGVRLARAVLPVVFGAAPGSGHRALRAHVEAERPDVLICVGQAGRRERVSVERIALNLDDAAVPDNAGGRPVDAAIEPEGPLARRASLPTRALFEALGEAGIPAELSYSAGTYVCNHLFFRALGVAEAEGFWAGFVHVPRSTEQCAGVGPSLPEATIVRALEVVASVAAARWRESR